MIINKDDYLVLPIITQGCKMSVKSKVMESKKLKAKPGQEYGSITSLLNNEVRDDCFRKNGRKNYIIHKITHPCPDSDN